MKKYLVLSLVFLLASCATTTQEPDPVEPGITPILTKPTRSPDYWVVDPQEGPGNIDVSLGEEIAAITIPKNWEYTIGEGGQGIAISLDGGYEINIDRNVSGGALCNFRDAERRFYTPQAGEILFRDPTSFTTQDGRELRRGQNPEILPDSLVHTVCERNDDGSYTTPTIYGAITYRTPQIIDADVMKAMDDMVASLLLK